MLICKLFQQVKNIAKRKQMFTNARFRDKIKHIANFGVKTFGRTENRP